MALSITTASKKILLTVSLFLLFTLHVKLSFSQERCAAFINHPKNTHENAARFEHWMKEKIGQRSLKQAQGRVEGTTYQIPVVVHVIHNGEALGTGTNIPDAQVYSQIDVLNKDFKRLNADAINTPDEFASVAGSFDIEFVLAKQAPDGSATTGIVRVKGSQAEWPFQDYDLLRAQSYWDSNDYFNIWVANIWGSDHSGYIGYSQFPVSNLPGLEGSPDNPYTDGVLIDYRTFGSIDDGAFNLDSRYNKGRTATHETGHFFGLRHIWGDLTNCQGTDYVDDTPQQDDSTGGCPSAPRASCINNVHEMYQNYLDYTNDACMNLFTKDQVNRMTIVIENCVRRVSLWSSHGLVDPSPVANDLGIAMVITPNVIACNSITPSVEIKNFGTNQITAAQIALSINNQVVDTKDLVLTLDPLQTTIIDFDQQSLNTGTSQFSFAILQTNGGTDGNAQNDVKIVNAHTFESLTGSTQRIPLREKFETDFPGQWTIVNPNNGSNWATTTTNFNSSAVFESFSNVKIGDESWLISPSLNLSSTDKASMFFDVSYAVNNNRLQQEALRVMISNGCTEGFTETAYSANGASLTEIASTSLWLPQENTDWNRKFVNLTPFVGSNDVRLAFVVTNGHGNNIYVDNIEFYNSDEPIQPNVDAPFFVYYNSNGTADVYVKFNFPEGENLSVSVVDQMGRDVYSKSFSNILNETLPIELYNATPGVYIARFQTAKRTYAKRILIGTN